MAREALIDKIGIGPLVVSIYEETMNYTQTASLVNDKISASGQKVSMQMVRTYLQEHLHGTVPADVVYDDDADDAALATNTEKKPAFVPINQIVNYTGATSVFQVHSVLEGNYDFLQKLLATVGTAGQALDVLREIRATAELAMKAAQMVRENETRFQYEQDVLDVMRDVAPDVYEEFHDRITKRRSIRNSTILISE